MLYHVVRSCDVPVIRRQDDDSSVSLKHCDRKHGNGKCVTLVREVDENTYKYGTTDFQLGEARVMNNR